jgi:hypothetical protein
MLVPTMTSQVLDLWEYPNELPINNCTLFSYTSSLLQFDSGQHTFAPEVHYKLLLTNYRTHMRLHLTKWIASRELKIRGLWSEPRLVYATTKQRGNKGSISGVINTRSKTHLTGFGCLFVQVYLEPVRASLEWPSPRCIRWQLYARQLILSLFLFSSLHIKLKYPPMIPVAGMHESLHGWPVNPYNFEF